MTSLREMQRNFINDCLSGELTDDNVAMEKDINTETISAKGRTGIYRESSLGNIDNSMQLTYPVVTKLVGENFFEATVRKYTEEYRPTTGDMDDYGQEFADFLESFPPAKDLKYLPDMARLEWLFHESSIADDGNLGDWAKLSELSPEEFMEVKIIFHPSVRLLKSDYPLLKIWEMNQDGADEDETINLDTQEGCNILVVRKGLKVDLYSITEDEMAFLQSLLDGCTLYDAFEAAIATNEEFALQDYIQKHVNIATFCDFK